MSLQPLGFNPVSEEELIERAAIFRQELSTRRSVRDFSSRAVPMRVIQNVIMTAASALWPMPVKDCAPAPDLLARLRHC